MGGNDAHVFFEDIRIQEAVEILVTNKLANNGQVCCSPKRIFVHASIFRDFKAKLLEEIDRVSSNKKFKNGILYGAEGVENKLQTQLEKWNEYESSDSNILRGNWNNGFTKDISVIEVHGNIFYSFFNQRQ